MESLAELLEASAALHQHLCPRQVLGVRMGMLAGQLLSLDLPQQDKRLLTIVETDGCVADGVAVATGCWVGKRTLRIEDYGKVAATFVDTDTQKTIRITPQANIRGLAADYAPEADSRWQAYLLGYQRMPNALLFSWQQVILTTPIQIILSYPRKQAICQICGEEIMNEREIIHERGVFCRSCVGSTYYVPLSYRRPVVAQPTPSCP